MKIPNELTGLLRIKTSPNTVGYLVTSSLEGRPNILASPLTDILDDQFVLLPDLFAQKTKVNLNENLRGAMSIALPESGSSWIVEGPCNIFQWGHPAAFRWQGISAGDVLGHWGNWADLVDLEQLQEGIRPTVVAQRGVIALFAEKISRTGGAA